MEDVPKKVEELVPPEEFYKIINDFIADILTTFPEYSGIISRWWNRPSGELECQEMKQKETLFVFRHCIKVFPERFFDILYKNENLFLPESEISTEFLPGIVFSQLWACDISNNTRETIWKYLQLILFSVIGCVHNSNELGDTAKLFEAINEDELKKKLEETLEGMQGLFDASNCSPLDTSLNEMPMPNVEQLHEHIQSMMGGKLGKLAMELAEETANDLNLDMDNTGTAKDVFQKLFKNPAKLMNMVKNIGSKIDEKIKSGEIKESELMEEGVELLQKMKNMPGMGDMQKMFSQMGIPGLGRGSKMNMGAMEAHLNRNMKQAKAKERMRAKSEAKNLEKEKNAFCNMSDATVKADANVKADATVKAGLSEEEIVKIFSTGEKVEKTPRGTKPPQPITNNVQTPNKKKKSKK